MYVKVMWSKWKAKKVNQEYSSTTHTITVKDFESLNYFSLGVNVIHVVWVWWLAVVRNRKTAEGLVAIVAI